MQEHVVEVVELLFELTACKKRRLKPLPAVAVDDRELGGKARAFSDVGCCWEKLSWELRNSRV